MREPHATGRQSERVLIVAPDEDARSMLAFLLRAEGFNVFCLADAPRARTLLTLCRGPVTVVLDASVPMNEQSQWFDLLSRIAQVRGVVMPQRPGVSRTVVAPRESRSGLPCVAVGHPLRIAALIDALTTVAARAERGQPGAAREQAKASQDGGGGAPVERSHPA